MSLSQRAVLALLGERVLVQHRDERAVDEDALDVGLRDERADEGPGARQVEVPLPRGQERVQFAPLEVEADVGVAPGLVGLVSIEPPALGVAQVADHEARRAGVAGLDRLDGGDDEVDRLLGPPGLARVADRPERPRGEGHGVEEKAGVGRADRQRPERRRIDLRRDEERLRGVRARPLGREGLGGILGESLGRRPSRSGAGRRRSAGGGRGVGPVAGRDAARRHCRAPPGGRSQGSGSSCRSVSSVGAPPGPQAHRRPGWVRTPDSARNRGDPGKQKVRWPLSGRAPSRRRRSAAWAGTRGASRGGSPPAPTRRGPASGTCGAPRGCGGRSAPRAGTRRERSGPWA